LQQVVHLHQQWPLEVAQEVEQGELAAAASAAYRAEAGQYLFPVRRRQLDISTTIKIAPTHCG